MLPGSEYQRQRTSVLLAGQMQLRRPPASGVLRGRTELSVPKKLVRDEQEQADYLTDLLDVFDRTGVHGTFIWGFSEPALITSDEPGRDLDLASYGIVAAHPDGTWTPKRAYHAIAERYRGTP